MTDNDDTRQILLDIRDITNELAKQGELNKSLLEKYVDNKESIDALSSRVQELEKQVIQISGIKKTIIAIGAVISLLIAFLSYYGEYISDKPNQIEQQKSLDLLWQK